MWLVDGQDNYPRTVTPFYLQNSSWHQTGGKNPQTVHAVLM
jgi:hypothetical protein